MAERRRKRSTAAPNEIITLTNVCKAYSTGAPALKDVNLHINRGEFVFIVGDSGSGKSTLIKLLLRELTITSGSINVMGYDLSKIRHRKIPKFRRNLGVVFQDFRLLKDRNVYDNVAFAQRSWGWQANIRRNRSSFPVVSSRESRWPEPWSISPPFFWRMSLPEIWIRRTPGRS